MLALGVPPEAMAELTAAGAVAATSVVKLETSIVQGETVANATWGAVQDEKLPLAAEGPTEFAGPVKAEPITVDAAGELSFTAVGMVATLTGWTEDGAATEPPSVTLTCVPDTDATLAVVPVTEAGESTTPSVEEPAPGIKVGSDAAAAPPVSILAVPPECHPIEPPPVARWSNLCANIAGYANVAKLDASVLQPPGLVNIAAGNAVRNCDGVTGKFCTQNTALPELNGEPKYPPAPGSFYSFGFVPTTGTMQLTQLGVGRVDVWFMAADQSKGEAVARLQVSARLFDAKVNGVPLELGPNCRTATPIDVVLRANPKSYSITDGGLLTGTITIPPFSGCGVNEDLDPIITGLVSGPGNYVKMTQGKVCTINNGFRCPPEVPIPQR
jgi:hypothetical protein